MVTTMCEPPPMMKAALRPAPPCTTPTTAHRQELQVEPRPSAAAPVAQERQPAAEPPFPPVLSPPLAARRPATTHGPHLDFPTSATPNSTPSPEAARANSLQLTPPRSLAISQESAASWTPHPSLLTTITATRRTTRPIAWASPHPAWHPWRPARPTKCMGWDLALDQGWGALGLAWVPAARLLQGRKLDWGSMAAPLASPTPRNTLTTPTAGIHRGCRLTCETEGRKNTSQS